MTISAAPLRFGANYTPRSQWMHAWMSLDLDEVRRDFAALADLGFDHLRIFPLWTVLQPNRTLIRDEAVDDVRAVVDVAAEFGLDASVDVIQGHLSSFDFIPSWLFTWHDKNMFTHPDALSGQAELVTRLGERLGGASNFLGFTLGNETNQFSAQTHPSPWPVTEAEAANWITTLLDAAHAAAPAQQHVHSEYDAAWYMDGHGFTPALASRLGDITTVHSWIFNGTAQRYGGRSVASDRHAEYMIELARGFAIDPAKPIWLQEVGAPSNCLTPAQTPDFLEATLRSVARTENLWGVTWWCSHDVSRSLADFPDLEYTLGLVDQNGEAKPIGRRFAELIPELRERRPAPARSVGIVVEVDENDTPVSRGAMSPGGTIFQAWVDACEAGADPAIVTSSDAARPEVLAARGITELIRPVVERTEYASRNTVV
ncbi:cellulase family glycosylhydrolase [Microbacterium maritypicum]|uniref:glycoside hydrolase 5 family protein n=1 Tax=Microbacterium maritypicum TaxID=33918 RepID=UPI001B33D5AE|nr:cellulase family glycosylhydrolase [Microbacterium liquefaciens]MBP5801642.1 cellulase family glycosylhydrolase [Microbacterium liquefaciens]